MKYISIASKSFTVILYFQHYILHTNDMLELLKTAISPQQLNNTLSKLETAPLCLSVSGDCGTFVCLFFKLPSLALQMLLSNKLCKTSASIWYFWCVPCTLCSCRDTLDTFYINVLFFDILYRRASVNLKLVLVSISVLKQREYTAPGRTQSQHSHIHGE